MALADEGFRGAFGDGIRFALIIERHATIPEPISGARIIHIHAPCVEIDHCRPERANDFSVVLETRAWIAVDRPERFGDRLETRAKIPEADAQRPRLNRHPCEKPLRLGVRELMHLQQIPAVFRDEPRDARQQADAVRAGEFKQGRGHWVE